MISKLYVGNLPFSTTAQELQNLFAEAGEVSAAEVILDKVTGRSRGFAFVEMVDPEEAQKAIAQFHGFSLDGRIMTVNQARPREERPARVLVSTPMKRTFEAGGGDRRAHDFTDRNINSGRDLRRRTSVRAGVR